MAQNIQWEPLPKLKGKLSKNTRTVFHRNGATGTEYTSVTKYPRDLKAKPLSRTEVEQRARFAIAAKIIKNMSESQIAEAMVEFKAQAKYKTLHGYLMARETPNATAIPSMRITLSGYISQNYTEVSPGKYVKK